MNYTQGFLPMQIKPMTPAQFAALPASTRGFYPVAVPIERLCKWYWMWKTLTMSYAVTGVMNFQFTVSDFATVHINDTFSQIVPDANTSATHLGGGPFTLNTTSPPNRTLPLLPDAFGDAIALVAINWQLTGGTWTVTNGGTTSSSPSITTVSLNIFLPTTFDSSVGAASVIFMGGQFYPYISFGVESFINFGQFGAYNLVSYDVAGVTPAGTFMIDTIPVPVGYFFDQSSGFTSATLSPAGGNLLAPASLWMP